MVTTKTHFAGFFSPTFASIAKKPVASKHARPAPLPDAGGAFKCTFCYDRQKSGLVPACAKVCPTESILFGRLDDLRARGAQRVQQLQQSGYSDAQLYDTIA